MKKANYLDGEMVPRLFKTNIGDIFTTNCFEMGEEDLVLSVGDTLIVGANGYLVKGSNDTMTWKVVKEYTLADGQSAVKVQRIK